MINNVKVIKHSHYLYTAYLFLYYIFHYLLIVNKFDIVHIHEPFPIGSLLGSITKKKTLFITFHSDIVKQKGLLGIYLFFY